MAHFVTEDAGQILVRPYKDIYSQATGEKIGALPTIWLQLERGAAPSWAVAEAVQHFGFSKRPRPGAIGGADIPVETWCVYVDTDSWAVANGHDDAIREKAEQLLRARPDVLEVVPPAKRPPWPNYDELVVSGSRTAEKVASRNLETAEMVGVTIDTLIEYEEATHRREGVLIAYKQALAAIEADVAPHAIVVEA